MDNNNTATIEIPVSEYTELVRAKLGIDMIGNSLNKYGVDYTVAKAVCKSLCYEYKEDEADA